MFASESIVRKTVRQVSCRINDDVAVLDMEKSLYFRLEGAAAQIWETLDNPSSVAQVCDAVVARFDVGRDQCEADVLDFLSRLQAQGLIEIVL